MDSDNKKKLEYNDAPEKAMLAMHIYDCVARQHQPIFLQPTINSGLRAAREVTKTMRARDFRLIIDGEWDDRSKRAPLQLYLSQRLYDIPTGTELTDIDRELAMHENYNPENQE